MRGARLAVCGCLLVVGAPAADPAHAGETPDRAGERDVVQVRTVPRPAEPARILEAQPSGLEPVPMPRVEPAKPGPVPIPRVEPAKPGPVPMPEAEPLEQGPRVIPGPRGRLLAPESLSGQLQSR